VNNSFDVAVRGFRKVLFGICPSGGMEPPPALTESTSMDAAPSPRHRAGRDQRNGESACMPVALLPIAATALSIGLTPSGDVTCAFRDEALCYAKADADAAAGNHGDLSFEFFQSFPSSRWDDRQIWTGRVFRNSKFYKQSLQN
jgi:hypothetical protein